MGKNYDHWFTSASIYMVAITCCIGIFYPEVSLTIALVGGIIAASFMILMLYILNI